MVESDNTHEIDDPLPAEKRCTVSSNDQFQLPAEFVAEVAFPSSRGDPASGAKAAWYYHEEEDKAVLANDTINSASAEFVGASSLQNISTDDLEAGDVTAARVTIITALPDHLYERLTGGSVVLKPVYEGRHGELNATCVSVYPAEEYDAGELTNVTRTQQVTETDDGGTKVQVIHEHQNSSF